MLWATQECSRCLEGSLTISTSTAGYNLYSVAEVFRYLRLLGRGIWRQIRKHLKGTTAAPLAVITVFPGAIAATYSKSRLILGTFSAKLLANSGRFQTPNCNTIAITAFDYQSTYMPSASVLLL